MTPPDLAAMALFLTTPTDRALTGWLPEQKVNVSRMTEADIARWIAHGT